MNRDDRRLRDKNKSRRGELKGYDMPYAFRSSLLIIPIPNVTPNRQLDSSSSSAASREKIKKKKRMTKRVN